MAKKTNPNETIIKLLQQSYNMELETVINYLSISIHLDGFNARQIKESLAEDVGAELDHARALAKRIKVLDGTIPGSLDLSFNQKKLQPPADALDIKIVVQGVIEAEEGAIAQYQKLIEASAEIDPVTNDLAIEHKGDEEEHRREFVGFLREIQRMGIQ
jgi:bacterioferritin